MSSVDFKIESGSSVYSVGEKLKKEGIIKNYFAYKTYVKIKGINGYKAGVYKLDKSLPVKDIVKPSPDLILNVKEETAT